MCLGVLLPIALIQKTFLVLSMSLSLIDKIWMHRWILEIEILYQIKPKFDTTLYPQLYSFNPQQY